MQQYSSIVLFSLLFFFIAQQDIFGQSVRSFTYGGSSGNRNGGKVTIQYFLQNGGRLQKLESNVIDLNSYGSGVRLIVQFSDLEVGLKPSGTGMKNSNHHNRYYLKASHQKSGLLSSPKNQAIQITAKGGHYGEPSGQIIYKINAVITERAASVKIKTEIVDANGGGRWNAIPIIKNFTLIPRDSDIANSVWSPIKKSWKAFRENPVEDLGKTLLEQCKEYLRNCEDGSGSCRNTEDALFYIIKSTQGKQQRKYIDDYIEKYGKKGEYAEEISNIPEVVEPEIPIEAGARVDSDKNYLVVNNIKGGTKPYWIKFFASPEDSLSLKNIDFAREEAIIDLKSLNMEEEGIYTIKVTDENGNVFITKDQVHIDSPSPLHPSVKLGGLLLLLGGVGFAYKKFIHF